MEVKEMDGAKTTKKWGNGEEVGRVKTCQSEFLEALVLQFVWSPPILGAIVNCSPVLVISYRIFLYENTFLCDH